MHGRSRRSARGGQLIDAARRPGAAGVVIVVLAGAAAAAAFGPGTPQATAAKLAEGLRETVLFADLDLLTPSIGATFRPGEHVPYPICLRQPPDTISLRSAPAGGDLSGPLDVGSTYTSVPALPGPLTPC